MENLKYYEMGREVPKEAQKSFNNGSFSGTDINPMWRIKKLTEMFGCAGIGWYTEILSERCEEHHDCTMAIVDINLYIKVDGEWSKPIFGTGGNKLVSMTKSGARASDEGYKMAYTDALSVACKALGIGADIYFGADKTKYTAYAEEKTEPKATPAQIAFILQRYKGANLAKLLEKYGVGKVEDLTLKQASEIIEKLKSYDAKKEA